jgi:hypothetical protein
MSRGNKTDVYSKWLTSGHLNGLLESDGSKLALVMEQSSLEFVKNQEYSRPLNVRTSVGIVNFELSNIIYKVLRNAYDFTDNKELFTIDSAALWNEVIESCVNLADTFYGGDGNRLFDSNNHDAFIAFLGARFARSSSKGSSKG